jgi:ethanolamine utilization microcompartment shell protein EutS
MTNHIYYSNYLGDYKMNIKFMDKISNGTLRILYRRVTDSNVKKIIEQNEVTTVGICDGNIADIIAASDIAEKSSNVIVSEVSGVCPQHIVCIAIFGNTAAVKTALNSIKNDLPKLKY